MSSNKKKLTFPKMDHLAFDDEDEVTDLCGPDLDPQPVSVDREPVSSDLRQPGVRSSRKNKNGSKPRSSDSVSALAALQTSPNAAVENANTGSMETNVDEQQHSSIDFLNIDRAYSKESDHDSL